MSDKIGDRLPAPLRFELGVPAEAGRPGRAVLLGTVDADGSVRFAVLASAEVTCADDKHVRFALAPETRTSLNLVERRRASLWYVLDAAGYTIHGASSGAPKPLGDGRTEFELEVEAVWRDFRPDAPMTSGPTYAVPEPG